MKLIEYSPGSSDLINKMILPDAQYAVDIKFLWCDIVKCQSDIYTEISGFHSHTFFEAIFALDGNLTYSTPDESIEIKDGGFALFCPGTDHTIVSGTDNTYKISLAFILDEKSELYKNIINSYRLKTEMLPNIDEMLNFILCRSKEDDVFTFSLIRGKLFEITYSIFEALNIPVPKNTSHSCDARVAFAKEYIGKNRNRLLGGGEVASACNLSLKQLNRIFVSDTGITVYDYITKTRLEEAKKLILDDKLSIKEIAFSLGFESESSFSSFFKRHSGMSAGAFKKHCTLTKPN